MNRSQSSASSATEARPTLLRPAAPSSNESDGLAEPVAGGWPVLKDDTNHLVEVAHVVDLIRRSMYYRDHQPHALSGHRHPVDEELVGVDEA